MPRSPLAVPGTAAIAGLAAAALSLAAAAPARAASSVTWSMDERSGSTMVPTNGSGPRGTIGSAVGLGAAGASGTAYSFPALASRSAAQPERLVTVPNSSGAQYLNPGLARIVVAMSVRTSGSGEYNVIQKGQARTSGGFYKMEINPNGSRPGQANCTFGSGTHGVTVASASRVNDGRWHRVACTKATSGTGTVMVSIAVDGATRTSATSVRNFAINNTLPLSIGGKVSCNGAPVECDYYVGVLDSPSLTIG